MHFTRLMRILKPVFYWLNLLLAIIGFMLCISVFTVLGVIDETHTKFDAEDDIQNYELKQSNKFPFFEYDHGTKIWLTIIGSVVIIILTGYFCAYLICRGLEGIRRIINILRNFFNTVFTWLQNLFRNFFHPRPQAENNEQVRYQNREVIFVEEIQQPPEN